MKTPSQPQPVQRQHEIELKERRHERESETRKLSVLKRRLQVVVEQGVRAS